jgi:hypothetical protein
MYLTWAFDLVGSIFSRKSWKRKFAETLFSSSRTGAWNFRVRVYACKHFFAPCEMGPSNFGQHASSCFRPSAFELTCPTKTTEVSSSCRVVLWTVLMLQNFQFLFRKNIGGENDDALPFLRSALPVPLCAGLAAVKTETNCAAKLTSVPQINVLVR